MILHYRNKDKLYSYPKPKIIPSVSIIVPAYNEENNIAATLNALINLEYPAGKKEIIVVDDESTDKTLEIAKKFAEKYSAIKLIHKKNSGKADSVNVGIKRAKGELIAVVDADSYPNKDALLKMIGYFDEVGVAAVTSRVLVKNKENWLTKFQVMDYSIIAWTRKLLDFIDSVYVTNGPISVYRKDVLLEIGGFDKKNLTEDIEVTWNILSRGYKTRMSYSAIVYTTVPEKFTVWVKQRIRWNLGGIQTIWKYWKSIINSPNYIFGRFVIPYVTTSFILALIGLFLVIRSIWITGSYHLYSLYYAFSGYSLFKYADFNFSISLLFIFAVIFLVCGIWYYKVGFKNSETGKKGIFSILAYSFIYRAFYVIPLVLAIYKMVRGDLRWYTK
ncbi:MAG: glycosyltransferase [Nanoarchaeota archaeon]